MALEIIALPSYEEFDHLTHYSEKFFIDEGLFTKLEPLWQYCREWDIRAFYYDDFVIPYDLLWRILKQKEAFITECMNHKPFGVESNTAALDFFKFVESARQRGDKLSAWCD